MKWSRSELIQSGNFNVTVDEDTVLPEDAFDGFSLIDGARDVHVSGTGFLDTDENRFYADLHIVVVRLRFPLKRMRPRPMPLNR